MTTVDRPFERVLIANRGEIAVRIIRACRDLGMQAIAVYSDVDAGAMHVALADQAIRIGPSAPAESYLRIDALIEAARVAHADAIHPGYGFLSERSAFARAVEDEGIAFIGPSSVVIERLGDKLNARRLARSVGVDPVPGSGEAVPVDRPDQVAEVVAQAESIGYPLLVKASAGGGGRGMRRVVAPAGLPAALAAGSSEALAAFGDGSVYLEREIRPARHIEVQLLGDAGGTVVAIGERDCSLQRRHQKLVEEAPAPGLTPDDRRSLHALAVRVGVGAGLTNAATAEFLRSPDGTFHFLEVNTRLQVEHGVTELVSGVDIVHEQFRLAAGSLLSDAVIAAAAASVDPGRHAIEVRVAAEDPALDFAPRPGLVSHWQMPSGPGVRVDTGLQVGDRVPPDYDNLIAKVVASGADRATTIDVLRRALDETAIGGIQTTLPFHRYVARHAGFRSGDLSTDWVTDEWDGPAERNRAEPAAIAALVGKIGDGSTDGVSAMDRKSDRPDVVDRDALWGRDARREAVDRWPG